MIEIDRVSKSFGATKAVDGVSFAAEAGSVTGFLGPNGAGKTTTLRVLLGLARPDAGAALVDGMSYPNLPSPRRAVGALLSPGFHPGRTGRNHLRIIARSAGIAEGRVDTVLDFVELGVARDRTVGGYSTGMKQRLGLAAALLGDPSILILDEPGTGLDPAGLAWLRGHLVSWAAEGRTVLFSSHDLSEVAQVSDTAVIINQGRIVKQGNISDLVGDRRVLVAGSPTRARLKEVARARGWDVRDRGEDRLLIRGPSLGEVGQLAADERIVLSELAAEDGAAELETLFLELTGASGGGSR